ncbi:MAG: hypothetical protein K0R41_17 [Geminicoccaceae bacterium]|jgi:hypothetical protein|nr:hypothetical protein [Solirubrobacterales bacterium]MCE3246192.1 hypothetical protein [Geminicoccaceae bacterium]
MAGGEPGANDHDERCRTLLEELRRLCPELVPGPPVPPGELAPPASLAAEVLQELVPLAVGATGKPRVVWQAAGSEVLVDLDATRVVMREGLVLVSLVLETEQTGRADVIVPFAVGSAERPAGMVVQTERKPRGPTVLVDRWGEAIIAVAWQALLDIADATARTAGRDATGKALRAGALLAEDDLLQVIPQAEHPSLPTTGPPQVG